MRTPLALVVALSTLAACAAEPPRAPATPTAVKVEPAKTPEVTSSPPTPPATPSTGATAPPLAKVLEEAKTAGTIPVLIFSTVWCQPCEMVEKDVLPNADVVKALEGYRLQKYDAEIGEGLVAAQKFGVNSYPTMIFLAADGAELARLNAPQTPDSMVETLKAKLALAKGKSEGAPDPTNPQKLLELARAEEAVAKPDLAKAKTLYTAVVTAAQKQKQPEMASEATFSLLQLDVRARDKKEHATALLSFLKAHATTTKALDALEGLAGLATEAGVKATDVKPSAAKVETALVAAQKDTELRRLALALKKLGDEEGAARAEAAAAKIGPNKPSTPEFVRFADPLATRFVFSGGSAKITSQGQFAGATTRHLVENCRHLPHPSEAVDVRVYTNGNLITKAVVLDPELPVELRTCLERSATSITTVPAGAPAKAVLHVLFAPAKH